MTDRTRPQVQLRLPGSKSVTHRAFFLAAQCPDGAVVRAPLLSGDTRSTLAVLARLGAVSTARPDGSVEFAGGALVAGTAVLDCGNSGTTLRLASGLVATLNGTSSLDGDASLRKRPNGPLLSALKQLGAQTDAGDDGRAPFALTGPIRAGTTTFDPDVSSQYLSSLALAATRLPGESRIIAKAPVASRPYLDLTVATAAAFGVEIGLVDGADGTEITAAGPQQPRCPRGGFDVASDWSSAAFPLVASAVHGVPVALQGLDPNSAQGDRAIVPVLRRFGQITAWSGRHESPELRLVPTQLAAPDPIDVGQTPDMFPALCALAACAPGTTVIAGAAGLRHKECDRIAAMARGLAQLGVQCEELADGIKIVGGGPIGAHKDKVRRDVSSQGDIVIDCEHDHRIHMAFAILAPLSSRPVRITAPECVAISYPSFHEHLQRILQQRPNK